MSWTLTLSLVLPAIVFVAFMHHIVKEIRKKAFVYPSEAIIDQILPPEVLEEVLLNTDMATIISCAQVSKYWHHHATKDQIQNAVFAKIGSTRALAEDLQKDFKPHKSVNLDSISWLTYPDNYRPQWHAEDKMLADRMNKQIIDASASSVVTLKTALGAPAYGPYNNPGNAAKYLAKLRVETSHQNENDWLFRNSESNFFTVPKSKVRPHWRWSSGATVEIIGDLQYVQSHYTQFPELYSYRLIDDVARFAGFLRLNTNILYILFFWYTPCILVDYWGSTNPNKFYVDLLFAVLGAAGATFIGSIVVWDGIPEERKKRVGTMFIMGLVLLLGSLFLFSSFFREFFFFVGCVSGCFIYAAIIYDYSLRTGHDFRQLVVFVSYCLVISMNDWRLTVDAFKTNAIWFTLLTKLSLYAIAVLYAIIINWLKICAAANKFNLAGLLKWEKGSVEFLAWNLVSPIFITAYAPLTTHVFP